MAGDSGRVVAQRRQGRRRTVEIAAAQAEETAPTQATHTGGEAGPDAGASRAAEVFNRTNEKRTTVMFVRFDFPLVLSD